MSVDPSELNANAAALFQTPEPVNPAPPTTVTTITEVPAYPVAEPGSSTSEWKAGITVFVTNTLALAVAFGVQLTAVQQSAILAWVASTTTLVGLYGISRSIRKKGTTS